MHDPDKILSIPTFRDELVNPGAPNEMIVTLANDKVIKIWRAHYPLTRWLLNTGWFDGKKEL